MLVLSIAVLVLVLVLVIAFDSIHSDGFRYTIEFHRHASQHRHNSYQLGFEFVTRR